MIILVTFTFCVAIPSATADKKTFFRVGMITDVGGVNDQSFNQSAWEGMMRAKKELGVGVSYQESRQDADFAPNLETMLDSGNDLIFGIGFKLADAVLSEAKQNPRQKYALIDHTFGKMPANMVGVVFRSEEAAFLTGYIAGKMTKTGKVGFIGGMNVPAVQAFQYGFRAGVKYANPGAEVMEQYAESFTDAAKGKAIANRMYQQGADIIIEAAGGVADGVIEAAREQNRKVIATDRDQNYLAPNHVISSAMKRVDNAVFNIIRDLKNGQFKGGSTIVQGLKEGGVDIAPSSYKNVPADILKKTAELKKKIISGKLRVPANAASYARFEAGLSKK